MHYFLQFVVCQDYLMSCDQKGTLGGGNDIRLHTIVKPGFHSNARNARKTLRTKNYTQSK